MQDRRKLENTSNQRIGELEEEGRHCREGEGEKEMRVRESAAFRSNYVRTCMCTGLYIPGKKGRKYKKMYQNNQSTLV